MGAIVRNWSFHYYYTNGADLRAGLDLASAVPGAPRMRALTVEKTLANGRIKLRDHEGGCLVIAPGTTRSLQREHDMTKQPKYLVAATLLGLASSLHAAESTRVGEVINGIGRATSPTFYARWMYDQDYIDDLAKDPDPGMQAAKKAVVQFEADTGKALSEGVMNQTIDAMLEKYMVVDYVQHDPNIPQGRKGLAD